jgi:hypothetical protein
MPSSVRRGSAVIYYSRYATLIPWRFRTDGKDVCVSQRVIIFTRGIYPDYTYDLRGLVDTWKTWNTLTRLGGYRTIGVQLGRFQINPASEAVLERIIRLDIDALCVRVLLMTREPRQCRDLIDLKGSQAQGLLNLLQTVRFHMLHI